MVNKVIDVAAAALEATTEAAMASRLLAEFEPELHAVTTCPRCDDARLGRWGTTRRGLQRWRCRGCGRTCTAATGTAIAHLHSIDKLQEVAADMLAETPRSCRSLAAALDLDRMTVWRWRRLIADVWVGLFATCAPVETDCPGATSVTLRESRKASREWVRHRCDPAHYPAPDRLRWIDYRQQHLPLPEPMSRYCVRVGLRNRANDDLWTPAGGCPMATCSAMVEPTCSPAKVSIDDAVPTWKSRDAQGERQLAPATPLPLASQFSDFLVPFTGPATRHLRTYVAWFHARIVTMA